MHSRKTKKGTNNNKNKRKVKHFSVCPFKLVRNLFLLSGKLNLLRFGTQMDYRSSS